MFCETPNKVFCSEHAEIEVQQDWALVYQSTEISESELIKSILESSGHKVLGQNFNSIGFVWDGGGDSPISRSNINKPAKVLYRFRNILKRSPQSKNGRAAISFVTLANVPPSQGV